MLLVLGGIHSIECLSVTAAGLAVQVWASESKTHIAAGAH